MKAETGLVEAAWDVREHARSTTKVGCAVLDVTGGIHVGCNIGHQFRSHDIHAETNALGSMIAAGADRPVNILIVAERELFTPCGACLDWIFELGGPGTSIGFQSSRGGLIRTWFARDLMPFYPS